MGNRIDFGIARKMLIKVCDEHRRSLVASMEGGTRNWSEQKREFAIYQQCLFAADCLLQLETATCSSIPREKDLILHNLMKTLEEWKGEEEI